MKRIHYGEYLIETDGRWARVFDKVSHRRLFEGDLDRVMRELEAKLEGALDFDLKLDFNGGSRRKKKGWL